MAGALSGSAVTPSRRAAVDALPPAREDSGIAPESLRESNPQFSLRQILRPVRWVLLGVVVCLALDSAAAIAFPSLVRYAIDHGVVTADSSTLWIATAFGALLVARSDEQTAELQSIMRISYAVFCLNKKQQQTHHPRH